MPAHFKTAGPFKLSRTHGLVNRGVLDTLWTEEAGLGGAIGVYVLAVQKSEDEVVPWYVGKSDAGFAKRIRLHSVFVELAHTVPNGDLLIFFLSRVTARKAQYVKPQRASLGKGKGSKLKKLSSISRLEYLLIGSCQAINPNLLNKQLKVFNDGFVVPGFLGPLPNQADKSANAFAKMLSMKNYVVAR